MEKRPLLRPTDKRGKQPSIDFVSCFENAWEGHWYSACQIHIRTRARKSKWTTGGYGALRRCGCSQSGKRTQFHCLKFRLGSAGEPTICSHCYDVLNEDGVNSDFEVKFDLEGQGQSQTKLFCIFCPNLVVLAWTRDELWCGQAQGWRTHTQTDRCRQRQYPKAKTGLG